MPRSETFRTWIMMSFLFCFWGKIQKAEGHWVYDERSGMEQGENWKRKEESRDITILPLAAYLSSSVPIGWCGWRGLIMHIT